jgi:hypothetical protein
VCSEGSDLHLLQLAGRSFNTVHVLERRTRVNLFSKSIKPRCTSYRQSNVTHALISALSETGEREEYAGISIPSPTLLFQAFAAAGCDIRRHYDQDHFREAVHGDMINWLKVNIARLRRRNWQESDLNIVAELHAAGLPALAESVRTASRKAARSGSD